MRCEECRDAISAQLDGEDLPGEAAAVELHVAGCRDCRAYADRAARITRLARTRLAEPGPDLVGAVLAAPTPPTGRARVTRVVRAALFGLGIGQAALAIAGIATSGQHAHTAVETSGASAAHLLHEGSAWNLALAVAFLLAATGVSRVAGLVPVLGSFIAALAVLSVLDLLAGRVEPERLLGHGLAVAGFLLLVGLRLATGDGGGGSGRRTRADAVPGGAATPEAPRLPRLRPADGDGLAPTARRRAA